MPTPERVCASQMHAFMQRIVERHAISPAWEALRTWSLEHSPRFWRELIAFAEISPSRPATRDLVGDGMLNSTWFEGMTLNYARHMLRFDGDEPAIFFEREVGPGRVISRRELRELVARAAAGLRAAGVQRGDRVAAFMPNVPATLILMLAAASLGAIWSSCSPDFGVRGVLDRFSQIEPVVLLASIGYTYGGKRYDTLPRVAEIIAQLPSVRRVVVAPYPDDLSETQMRREIETHLGARGVAWADFLVGEEVTPRFEEVPFNHPLFIMYSSGTTGVPKCIVHGHGGTLVQHMKELMLHCDLRAGERIFYYTTCGWMMWNWLVSGIGTGAAIVLYDGSPTSPTADRLWQMAAELRVHVFGASPKYLGAIQKLELTPGNSHDLSALRAVLSTGSPLSAELFRWVYDAVKRDLQLSSISGGTDIISCFMLGNPLLPVYAGEIQCRGLGMDVQAWDERQQPVIGEKGELVCTRPFPSQPVGFWNDPDGAKYRKAYFDHYPVVDAGAHGSENAASGSGSGSGSGNVVRETFVKNSDEATKRRSDEGKMRSSDEGHDDIPHHTAFPGSGFRNSASPDSANAPDSSSPSSLRRSVAASPSSPIWRHGDYIEITPTGGIIVYGRSDATLNPGGVRIGTAEIYRIVEGIPEVLDSIVVGRETADQDVDVCLFVVLRAGLTLDDVLRNRIRDAIAQNATKRHVPRYIRQVRAIPVTISGKKTELAVQQILQGQEVKNRDALANPEALDEFRGILP